MTVSPAIPADGGELKAYDVHPGQVWRSLGGERIEIVADDGPAGKPLKVRYPDRIPQPTLDGDQRDAHVAFMSRYSFADAANYEGYSLVDADADIQESDLDDEDPEDLPGEWTEDAPPRCPVCGAFMGTGMDGMGLPAAECSVTGCHGFMDDRELIDGGYFRED